MRKRNIDDFSSEIKVEVFGRVQGVGFRHFVKANADKLGLKGFVMNKDDGCVQIVAQGEKENLDVFLRNIQVGPALAKVDGVSYFWSTSRSEKFDDFVIALDRGMIEDQKRSFLNLGKKVFNIKKNVPVHIAIIPDGNRRWAKLNGLRLNKGHEKASRYESLFSLFKEARELGVKYVTLWVFSTENWNRSSEEVKKLFFLFFKRLKDFRKEAVKNKIRFRHLGRKDRIPKDVVLELEKLEDETKEFEDFYVQICLDYGGRDEIARAVNKMIKTGLQEVNEDDIKHYLDSQEIPDPDLIIRTSGEKRISGFMPFQSAYAELYFTDVLFPDFGPEDLKKAVEEFGIRRRNFGK